MKLSLTNKQSNVVLFVMLICLFSLFVFNNDFPLGFNPDEVVKVKSIKRNTQSFQHPILILQSVKLANIFADYKSSQDIVELARYTTAFYATLSALFVYLITSLIARDRIAGLLATLLYGVTPGVVVHAHYIKEDIALTAFLLLTIYFALSKWNTRRSFLLIGLGFGLALASHYKSLAFIPLLLLLPIMFPKTVGYLWSFMHVGAILLLAFSIFLAINYPILTDFDQFQSGLV